MGKHAFGAVISVCVMGTLSVASMAQTTNEAAAPLKTESIQAVIYSTRGDEKVHVLASDDLRLLASIDVGAGLHELALDSSGRFLMGSAYGGPGAGHQPADNRVVVVDLAKRAVHETIVLDGLQRPNDIAFVPGTLDAFVTSEVPQHIVRVNAETGEVVKHKLKDGAGHMLALAKDAKKVYVSHVKPGGLSVVDAGSGELSRFVKLPDGAEGMAISPDGESVWVASHQASRISVISTATNDVTQSIICPGMPFRMKFAPSGKVAAISCPGAGAIAFIDLETPTKVEFVDTNLLQGKPIGLQNTPTSIAFSLDGTQVFAVGSGDQSGIVAVNAATRTLTRYAKSLGPIPDALTAGKIQWGVE